MNQTEKKEEIISVPAPVSEVKEKEGKGEAVETKNILHLRHLMNLADEYLGL